MFALVDFGVFGIFLLLSLFVGLYHGIGRSLSSKSEQQHQQNSKTGDFLDGGRRLPVFPVCLSLLTTFVSGIGLLGVPAEIYTKGSGLFIYTMAGTLAFPIIGIFFIPIFYKIKYCSMPSLGHAHRVLNLTIPANIIIQLMITYIGFLMVAFFQGCDPVALKEVKTMDQLTILMANRIFGNLI
uniref:Sodium-coupled monocarboxylate transporter 1 n=1 Tax=Meloidogyne javanica TaxID=6303 RepID=A0A915NA25_MELJA